MKKRKPYAAAALLLAAAVFLLCSAGCAAEEKASAVFCGGEALDTVSVLIYATDGGVAADGLAPLWAGLPSSVPI